MLDDLRDSYAKSGDEHAEEFLDWRRYSQRPYISATHGNRYVQNYGNEIGKSYGNYEQSGTMPEGSVFAKDSFGVSANGQAQLGPLFLMEKMSTGWNTASDDWRYTLIMPNGQVVGTTKGEGDGNVEFCIACHLHGAVDSADSVLFLPDELRAN